MIRVQIQFDYEHKNELTDDDFNDLPRQWEEFVKQYVPEAHNVYVEAEEF